MPLICLGFHGSPSLGLGFTNVLVISLGLWMVYSRLCTMNGDDALVTKVGFVGFMTVFDVYFHGLTVACFLPFVILLVVVGDRVA